ncbi:hypothetical protein H4R33_004536 [Dimargaris cristalligena]|nr:hypothetical protein H4R33_004536 [Dimargaris cristalligena]
MALYVASRPQPSATGPRTIDPTPETEAGDNAIWYDARSGNFNDEAWDNSEVDDHATDATHSSDTHGGIVSQSESDIEQPPAEHSKPTHKNLPLKPGEEKTQLENMKNGLEQEWVYVNYDSLTGQQQLAAFPLLFLLIKQWRGKGGSPFVLMVSGFLALMVLEFKVTSLREWAFEILEDNTDNPHQCAKILGYERVMHEIDNRKWARARRGYTWQDCFLKYGLSGSLIVRKPKGSVQSVVAIRVRKETFLKQVKDGEGAILSPEYAKNLLAPSIELQQDE